MPDHTNIIKDNVKVYDFFVLSDIIDAKMGINQRNCGKHYHPETGTFNDWFLLKGYPKKDTEGKIPSHSQIWFAEFQSDIKNSLWNDTPYYDFWHWQTENCFLDPVSNGSYSRLNISKDVADDAESWQKDIQKYWNQEFSDIADENGFIFVYLSW